MVVHRRCTEPMFSISNVLSYGNTMKLKTQAVKKDEEEKYVFEKSAWIDIKGQETGMKDHFIRTQGERALDLITDSFRKHSGIPDLFVISPFTTVINGFIKMVNDSCIKKEYPDNVKIWLDECCGTVHKFQGKEAREVIFLLGCDEKAFGAVMWVKSNILNVAVTRAKHRLYIMGDYNVWKRSDIFRMAHDYLGDCEKKSVN